MNTAEMCPECNKITPSCALRGCCKVYGAQKCIDLHRKVMISISGTTPSAHFSHFAQLSKSCVVSDCFPVGRLRQSGVSLFTHFFFQSLLFWTDSLDRMWFRRQGFLPSPHSFELYQPMFLFNRDNSS